MLKIGKCVETRNPILYIGISTLQKRLLFEQPRNKNTIYLKNT